jgi:hypothetical protein
MDFISYICTCNKKQKVMFSFFTVTTTIFREGALDTDVKVFTANTPEAFEKALNDLCVDRVTKEIENGLFEPNEPIQEHTNGKNKDNGLLRSHYAVYGTKSGNIFICDVEQHTFEVPEIVMNIIN